MADVEFVFQGLDLDRHGAESLIITTTEKTGYGIVCRLVVLILGGAVGAFFFVFFVCTLAGFGLIEDGSAHSFTVASVSFMFSMQCALLAARIVYFSVQFFREVDAEFTPIGIALMQQLLFALTCLVLQLPMNWVMSHTPFYYGFSFFSFWFPRIILPFCLGWILIYQITIVHFPTTSNMATRLRQLDSDH